MSGYGSGDDVPMPRIHICKITEFGAVTHSLREPDGTESPVFVFGMICSVIGIVIVAETVAPGSVGTLIKSMFMNQ